MLFLLISADFYIFRFLLILDFVFGFPYQAIPLAVLIESGGGHSSDGEARRKKIKKTLSHVCQ